MARSYLPDTDAALLEWTNNFAEMSIADPPGYGLTLAQAGAYQDANSAWAAAYAASQAPATRGPATILAKNNARTAIQSMSRELAAICQAYPGMTNLKRQALGLTIRDIAPTPVPVPTAMPDVDLVGVVNRTVTVRVHSASGAPRRGKPAGAAAAWVYTFVGAEYPIEASGWTFVGSTTKSKFEIAFPGDAPAGQQVWIRAAWINAKQETGPMSVPITTNLQGGGAQAVQEAVRIAA